MYTFSFEANGEIFNESNYDKAQAFKERNLTLEEEVDPIKHRHYVDRRSISRAMRLYLLEEEMRNLKKNWSFKSYSARDDSAYTDHLIEIDNIRLQVIITSIKLYL